MTTGISDFITTAGFQIAILLIPVPALAVPYAAPRSQIKRKILASTRAILTPINPKKEAPSVKLLGYVDMYVDIL